MNNLISLSRNVIIMGFIGSLSFMANATPIDWTINSMAFNDGGTASGSFTYDADTNMYSNISITTTAGSILGGNTYTLVDTPNSNAEDPRYFIALDSFSSDLAGVHFLTTQFDSNLTNLGGTVGIIGFLEGTCGNAICSLYSSDAPTRIPVSGSVSSTTSVPEPATLALLGFGLIGLGFARRKS